MCMLYTNGLIAVVVFGTEIEKAFTLSSLTWWDLEAIVQL